MVVIHNRGPALLVGSVAAIVVAWRTDAPSPWRDEGASWLAAVAR
jgi:hypothetical protein